MELKDIIVIGTWVTVRIVEPKLGKYDASNADSAAIESSSSMSALEPIERKALLWALLSAIALGALVAALVVPENGLLRNPEDGKITPFLKSIVALIFVFFVVPGIVFGRIAGTLKSDRDVIDAMGHAMSSMGLYIVLVFFAAQMVAFFKWTNLGSITAVLGADFLHEIGLTGPLVFIPFILMCCLVNLMLGSASAQWAMTAPIFVPMLMRLGYSPEVIQAAYRIGDSTTNIITPMMSYFGLILAFAHRYDRTLGIGTILSTMIPYSIAFLCGWLVLFYLWVFGLQLPVGPGVPLYIPV